MNRWDSSLQNYSDDDDDEDDDDDDDDDDDIMALLDAPPLNKSKTATDSKIVQNRNNEPGIDGGSRRKRTSSDKNQQVPYKKLTQKNSIVNPITININSAYDQKHHHQQQQLQYKKKNSYDINDILTTMNKDNSIKSSGMSDNEKIKMKINSNDDQQQKTKNNHLDQTVSLSYYPPKSEISATYGTENNKIETKLPSTITNDIFPEEAEKNMHSFNTFSTTEQRKQNLKIVSPSHNRRTVSTSSILDNNSKKNGQERREVITTSPSYPPSIFVEKRDSGSYEENGNNYVKQDKKSNPKTSLAFQRDISAATDLITSDPSHNQLQHKISEEHFKSLREQITLLNATTEERNNEFLKLSNSMHTDMSKMENSIKHQIESKIEDLKERQLHTKNQQISKLESELNYTRKKLIEKDEETNEKAARNTEDSNELLSKLTSQVLEVITELNEQNERFKKWQKYNDKNIEDVLRIVTDSLDKMAKIPGSISEHHKSVLALLPSIKMDMTTNNDAVAMTNRVDHTFDVFKDLSSKLFNDNNENLNILKTILEKQVTVDPTSLQLNAELQNIIITKLGSLTNEFKMHVSEDKDKRALDNEQLISIQQTLLKEISTLNNYHDTFDVENRKAEEDFLLKKGLQQDFDLIKKERSEIISLKLKTEKEIEERMKNIKKEEESLQNSKRNHLQEIAILEQRKESAKFEIKCAESTRMEIRTMKAKIDYDTERLVAMSEELSKFDCLVSKKDADVKLKLSRAECLVQDDLKMKEALERDKMQYETDRLELVNEKRELLHGKSAIRKLEAKFHSSLVRDMEPSQEWTDIAVPYSPSSLNNATYSNEGTLTLVSGINKRLRQLRIDGINTSGSLSYNPQNHMCARDQK